MLETRIENGTGRTDGDVVIILMHGRGADMADLAPLRRWLPEDAAIVLPRAPFPGAPWGYGPGWAWYRYEGEDRPEEESFRSSQAALDELVDGLASVVGFEPGPVVLSGFSQGGTMSLGQAIRRPGDAAAAINLSGFLPSHPDVVVTPEAAGATPFFWGHGTADPAVYFDLARSGRARLRAAGARLDAKDYRMGHGIIPEEMEDAVTWLGRVLRARAGSPAES